MKKTLLSLGIIASFYTTGWCQTESVHSSSADLLAYNSTTFSREKSVEKENIVMEEALLEGQGEAVTISFYPNPVKDNLNVRFKEKGNYTIRIYNIVGEKIREKTVLENDLIRVDLSDLPNGMYFLSYEPSYGRVITKTFSKGQ